MSRRTALWSAAVLTLLLALIVGTVVMGPVLGSEEDQPAAAEPTVVMVPAGAPQDGLIQASWQEYDDEDHDGDEHDDDHDEDDEHGEDDDDD